MKRRDHKLVTTRRRHAAEHDGPHRTNEPGSYAGIKILPDSFDLVARTEFIAPTRPSLFSGVASGPRVWRM